MANKFLAFRGKIIELHQGQDGFWRDWDNTIYAFSDDSMSTDPVVRCGVGIFSLPADSPLTDACRPDDFMYSSKVFQFFHTRQEALDWLENNLKIVSKKKWYHFFVPELFKTFAKWFGGKYWENKETR